MKEAERVLVGFGGHEQAGGFSFKKENKEKLAKALNDAIDRVEVKEKGKEETIIDEVLSFDDVNNATYEAINVLAPFGVGNAKPTFSFTKTKPLSVRRFGKKNEHIEVMYPTSPEGFSGHGEVKAIKFFVDDELEEKLKKEHVLVAHIEKSVFRGKTELRLRIKEVG
jgi:single-stranded-DNA-specific exonuclease